ncbi:CDP-glycerol glycerophosphotransferase family protein [Pseudoxanthomonas sp. 10H]|uniref:CDP-glycerol glycerophosphotransferase family protein n=1 Tax=Pseudoxanthomonas sp. 10H TaxID=3242729 RepID=UPI0035586656
MSTARARLPPWRRRIVHAWLGVPLLGLWRLLDLLLPKRMDRWGFFAHPLKPGQFIENARAVHEQVRHDRSIECRIFVRGGHRPPGLEDSPGTRVVDLDTVAGLWALARCGVLLLTNSTAMDMALGWRGGGFGAPRPWLRRRVVVNLWHGIPLKRLFALANPEQRRHGDRNRFRRRERRHYDGLVASSAVDGHAMAAIFHPLPPSRVWVTGLPRNDFLRMPEARLPPCLREELLRVRTLRDGRRLVLYAPTYRDASVAPELCYRFSDVEVHRLKQLLDAHGAVLGVRGHYLANAPSPFDRRRHVDGRLIVELEHDAFHEIAPILRESAAVVTDYSSVYIDALCLDLPVVSFAWDLEHYDRRQNGLLYDMELAFPGPVTRSFEALLAALGAVLAGPAPPPDERYRATRRMFFQHDDGHNSRRVVERIRHAVATRGGR